MHIDEAKKLMKRTRDVEVRGTLAGMGLALDGRFRHAHGKDMIHRGGSLHPPYINGRNAGLWTGRFFRWLTDA